MISSPGLVRQHCQNICRQVRKFGEKTSENKNRAAVRAGRSPHAASAAGDVHWRHLNRHLATIKLVFMQAERKHAYD